MDNKKFNIDDWSIETPKGWKKFKGVKKYNKRVLYLVTTEKNKSVVVSANHAFLDENNNKILCKNCLNKQIQTKDGLEIVIKKEKIGKNCVYDIVDVDGQHVFYANEILHHNTHLIEEFWSSVIPVVSSGKKSKIFAVSTPNGTDNKFYEVYSVAERGKSAWKAERVDWWDIPGRTEKWKEQQIQLLGSEEKFLQEYGNVFLDQGNSAVGAAIIERFKENKKNPIYTLDHGNYKIFETPDINKFYVIGVDVGEGIGRASSVAQVLDVTDLKHIEQVAVYASNSIEPYHFANNLVKLCNQWGNPPLLVERNNCGGQVIDALFYKHEYEKIVSCSKISPTNTQASRHLGILSHTNLRFAGVTNMRYWINTLQSVYINDIDTIKELETFIKYPNGTYRKKNDNFYDDRVMSLVWVLFILEPDICQQYFQIDDFDNQGKPLCISDIGYWEKDARLYGIRELSNSEVITPSIPMSQITNLNQQSTSLFNDKDLFPEEEKDIWDLTSEGWRSL